MEPCKYLMPPSLFQISNLYLPVRLVSSCYLNSFVCCLWILRDQMGKIVETETLDHLCSFHWLHHNSSGSLIIFNIPKLVSSHFRFMILLASGLPLWRRRVLKSKKLFLFVWNILNIKFFRISHNSTSFSFIHPTLKSSLVSEKSLPNHPPHHVKVWHKLLNI